MRKTVGCIFFFFIYFNSLRSQSITPYMEAIEAAEKYYHNKRYKESFEQYKNAFLLGSASDKDLYNAACSACLGGFQRDCLDFLKQAIQSGYLNIYWMGEDPDLDIVRENGKWKEIVTAIEAEEERIEHTFDSVAYYKHYNLIPFFEKGKWGYMDKETNKKVVAALYDNVSFVADCFIIQYGQSQIRVLTNGRIESIGFPRRPLYFEPTSPAPERIPRKGVKGFQMDKQNRIISYSDKYYTPGWFGISQAFRFKNKWVAFAYTRRKGWEVIDKEGNPVLPLQRYLRLAFFNTYSKDSSFWFYFADTLGHNGFMNSTGEIKLYDELNNPPFSGSNGGRMYSIQKKNNLYGIIDLNEMKWIISPKYHFIQDMDATHYIPCGQWPQEKDIIEVYFLVVDKDGSKYYMDVKERKYIP